MYKVKSFSFLSCLMFVVTPTAWAEGPSGGDKSASGEPANALAEVVVTARRVSERLQTVPVSVTAFGPGDIAERGIVNVVDVAMTTPNLHLVPAIGSQNTASFTLRGEYQRENLLTVDPSVGVYVDDVYYARDYSVLGDLLDVASVEVLKGPQGTLYGRNTTGGAIKIETAKPDANGTYSGNVKAGFGNFHATTFSGSFNAPIVPGVLALRYAGSYRWHDGYTSSYLVPVDPASGVATSLTPIERVHSDNENRYTHRVSARYTPNDKLTIDLVGSVFHANENGPLNATIYGDIQNFNPGSLFTDGGATVPPDSSPAAFSYSPQRRADFYSALTDFKPLSITDTKAASSTLQWDISEQLTLKAILGYVQASDEAHTNSDGTVNAGLALANFNVVGNHRAHQTSEELQLLGKAFDKRLSWIAGVYNFNESGHEDSTPGSTQWIFNRDQGQTAAYDAHNKSKSVFGNAIFSVTDAFRINGGARYTEDTKGIDSYPRFNATNICVLAPTDANGNPIPGLTTSTTPNGPCHFVDTAKFSYVTWEIGGDYRLTDDVFAYLKANNGVRSGGQQGRIPVGIFPAPFRPEKVMNYEAGLKSEFFDKQLRLNLSVFHVKKKDVQASVIEGVASIAANQGNAKIDGFELEATARLGSQLTVSSGIGYTNIKFDDPKVVQPNSPKLTLNISPEFVQPTPIGELKARLDYNYTGPVYYDTNAALPQNTLGGHGLLNARLGLSLQHGLEVSIFGKNLAGKEYYNQAFQAAYTPGFFWGLRQAYEGPPRTYGVEANYKF